MNDQAHLRHGLPGSELDEFRVTELRDADWTTVSAIYTEGIATGHATFQTRAPEWEAWNASHSPECRLVLRNRERIIGWAALSPVSARAVYRGVAEVSIYVAAAQRGKGHGKRLLAALIECSEAHGFWTLQAGIFPENRASLELHASYGFRIVGKRERLGQLGGKWRDVLLLERRSVLVGARGGDTP